MLLSRIESIGRGIKYLQRFRDIVPVCLRCGYSDIAEALRLSNHLELTIKRLREEQERFRDLSASE
ncbi:MAG: hypothetical protein M2R45_05020 [Verrucomicrobia subdivision 3 bacterium]|nr:hypothetical protein [Limisphaerales bacterium]MCS1417653.1 hypothetical protein [Limisphaerales bacterium]